jgi:hypothetical protein
MRVMGERLASAVQHELGFFGDLVPLADPGAFAERAGALPPILAERRLAALMSASATTRIKRA